MLALYRSGRQAEALAAYREARRTLVDELGIEPSPELRGLEQSILRQEAGPPTAPPDAAPAPARALRRRVTCLVSDLAGSAELGELLDPEILRPLLIRATTRCRWSARSTGARCTNPSATGSSPSSGRRSRTRTTLCAPCWRPSRCASRLAELNAELEPAFGVELAARTGLNTGEVLTPGKESETLVLGSAGSVAARLEQAAAPGEILLGEATRSIVGDAVLAELSPGDRLG